jgi:hypothetical protein
MGGNEIRELSHASFKSMVFSPCLMKTILTAAAAVVATFAIIGGIFGIAVPVHAQTNATDTTTPDMSMEMGGEMMTMMRDYSANHKWGMIASMNNDGQAEWILSGHWTMELASQNDTATSETTGMISNVAGFDAMIQMVMPDGSAMHSHEISNFTQTGDATFNSETNSTTIPGTLTITMREGPVPDVQTTIEIAQDKVIAIRPDPAALQNHFGDAPIYGIVVSPEMIKQMMMGYGDRGGMKQGPMDGMMMNSSSGM